MTKSATAVAFDDSKPLRPLPTTEIRLAKHERQEFRVTIDADEPKEHLFEPAFWKKVGQQLRPFDEIIAVSRDGRRYFKLLVLDSSMDNGATMHLLAEHELPDLDRDRPMPNTHRIIWSGPDGFSVVRNSDNRSVASGFRHRGEAYAALLSHAADGTARPA